MPEEINEIRKENLRKVIKDHHKGDYKEVGSLINKTEGTVRKYFSPSANRPISDRLAREIEKKLNLPLRYLDKDNNKESEVYFVMLMVENNERYRVVQWLYENCPEVLDCSAILGQYDVLLKVQVPSMFYLDKFFARLSRQPNIFQTQTLASVNTLRFQKTQTESKSIEDPRKIKNYMDYYKNSRLNDLAIQMQDIERGKIVASDKSAHRISLHEIMSQVKASFFSVREYQEKIYQYDGYLKEEKFKIKEGIQSKRIFLLPKDLISNNDRAKERKKFFAEVKRVIDIGSEVRFLFNEYWLSRGENLDPECFAVVDHEFVYVRKQEKKKAVLHENDDYIQMYQKIFDRNWEIATPHYEAKHREELL